MQKLSIVFALFALAAIALGNGSVTPKIGCAVAYSTVVATEQDDGSVVKFTTNTKMMHKDGVVYVYQDAPALNITSALVRCDIKDDEDKCYSKIVQNTTDPASCDETYIDNPDPSVDDVFYYDGEPQDTECPDTTATGCKLYCNTTEKLCIVLNADEFVVQLRGEKFNYTHTYLPDPSVDDFAGKKCDGSDLPAPVDLCAPVPQPKTITPKFECAMHISQNMTTEKGSIVTDTKIMMTKDMVYVYQHYGDPVIGSATAYVRCDIKNEDGDCFTLLNTTDDGCSEQYSPYQVTLDDPFYYDVDPVDVDCPYEGISGCKKYCNTTDEVCCVFDSEGYFVQMIMDAANTTLAYLKDGVNVEDFVGHFCNGTDMSVPENICGSPAPSSATPAPSAHSSSSASMVEVAIAVVVAAIVIALF